MEEVPNILWGSNDLKRDIFGPGKVYQYNVFSFFFQLIATGILVIDYEGNDGVRFLLACAEDGTRLFEQVSSWEGFEFRTSGRGRTLVSFSDLLQEERMRMSSS